MFESYELIIDQYSVSRKQHNTNNITIAKSDISEITKYSNGSYSIKGKSSINIIGVPPYINNFQMLEQSLAEIRPVLIKNKKTFFEKYFILIPILTVGLFLAVFLSKNKIIVGIGGLILLFILGYSFVIAKKSKNIDNKTKKSMWWIILVFVSIFLSVIIKITIKLF